MQVEGFLLPPKKRFRVGDITYYYGFGKLQVYPNKRLTLKKEESENIILDGISKQRKNNTKSTFAHYTLTFLI